MNTLIKLQLEYPYNWGESEVCTNGSRKDKVKKLKEKKIMALQVHPKHL